jgi:hypothetical protein
VAASDPLPGLRSVGGIDTPDVIVDLQASSPWPDALKPSEAVYRSPDGDEQGEPNLTVDRLGHGSLFRIRYADGVDFVIDGKGERVWAAWPSPWTVDDVATYLLGPVLAFVLRLRGITCLHASAVAIEDRAVAFVGPAGAGKSTIAASFARRAHAVLSDDVLAVGADGVVHPGSPRIRLWPESVRALYGATDALPRLTPTWEKRFLQLAADGYRFEDRPLPLTAIYLLDRHDVRSEPPRLAVLPPAGALLALVANTQAGHLLDRRMRADEFRCLSGLVASVRVCRLTAPDDFGALPALCDAVLEDVLHAAADV